MHLYDLNYTLISKSICYGYHKLLRTSHKQWMDYNYSTIFKKKIKCHLDFPHCFSTGDLCLMQFIIWWYLTRHPSDALEKIPSVRRFSDREFSIVEVTLWKPFYHYSITWRKSDLQSLFFSKNSFQSSYWRTIFSVRQIRRNFRKIWGLWYLPICQDNWKSC